MAICVWPPKFPERGPCCAKKKPANRESVCRESRWNRAECQINALSGRGRRDPVVPMKGFQIRLKVEIPRRARRREEIPRRSKRSVRAGRGEIITRYVAWLARDFRRLGWRILRAKRTSSSSITSFPPKTVCGRVGDRFASEEINRMKEENSDATAIVLQGGFQG